MTPLGLVDRRVLGAFRLVDAFSAQQLAPGADIPSVRTTALDVRRNPSGIFIVFNAPGLDDLTTQFDPVKPWPVAKSYEVRVQTDGRQYLPRRAQVSVPRKPEPMTDPASSMIAQDVTMYPGPAAALGFNWAIVRVRVRKAGSADSDPGLPWAVLRLTRISDTSGLAVGLCDRRGEGVLAVPGAGQSTNGGDTGALINVTFDATVTAYFDPENARQSDQWVPDPDDVLRNLNDVRLKKASTAQPVKIGRGTLSDIKIPIAV